MLDLKYNCFKVVLIDQGIYLPHATDCDLLISIQGNEILKALQHFMGQCNNFWVFEELILNNFLI